MDDLESLIARLQKLIDAATGKLIDNLSPAQIREYHTIMEELLTRYHLAAYMVGAGTDVVSDKARAKVREGVANQLAFLQGFVTEIEDNDTFVMGWEARARMYGESIKIPYWAGKTKMLPLPALPGESSQCMTNCKCSWDIRKTGENTYVCRWVRDARDSCQTCVQRASEWKSLIVKDGVLELPND